MDERMSRNLELIEPAPKLVEYAEDLRSFQLAYDLSLRVHKLSFELPKHEQYELASQLRRASKGICSNITEGFAKQQFSKAEFKRFLSMAIGSATEVRLWLKYVGDLNYTDMAIVFDLRNQYENLLKMLQKLHKAVN